jgi:hypothetical protein
MSKEFYDKIRAILLENRKRPHKEQWQKMIDRGWIDAKGNVLLKARMPRDPALGPDPDFDDEPTDKPEA